MDPDSPIPESFLSFFFIFYLFIHETHTEREREREREAKTQAEGEAGFLRESDAELNPRTPGSQREPPQPLRHPAIPI